MSSFLNATPGNPETQEQSNQDANVVIGIADPDSFLAEYNDQVAQDSVFTDYMVYNTYVYDPQTVQMPVASPSPFQGASVAFVQFASPTLKWEAKWTAARLGTQPIIPEPLQSDPNWVFLGRETPFTMITVVGDGQTPLYRVSGTYVYGHKNPPANVTEDVCFPQPPWLLTQDQTMPAGNVQQGIINIVG